MPVDGYGRAIAREVQGLTVARLMDLAADASASPEVRSAASAGLRQVLALTRTVELGACDGHAGGHRAIPEKARRTAEADAASPRSCGRTDRWRHPLSAHLDYVTLDDIRAASARVARVARVTPLLDVSSLAGRPLLLKCENTQPGGAFKIRGAYNMVARLTAEQRRRGVITFSSGNHGQAVALAARELGAPAVVVMPTTAPKVKVAGTRGFGAEVIFEGTTSTERRARAEAEATARGLTMVPPFDHPWIIAGQGTAGLEILDQCPATAAVLVPIGGGGLAAGVSAAIKLSRPVDQGHWRRTLRRRGDEGVDGRRPGGDARPHTQHRRWPDAGSSG